MSKRGGSLCCSVAQLEPGQVLEASAAALTTFGCPKQQRETLRAEPPSAGHVFFFFPFFFF